MPKFYFDVFDGEQVLADQFGDEFPSEQEAARQAIGLIPALAADSLEQCDNLEVAVSLRSGDGHVVFRSIAVVRSQWPDRARHDYRLKIRDVSYTVTHAGRLREESRELSARLRVNTLKLMSAIESAAGAVEMSRKLRRGKGP